MMAGLVGRGLPGGEERRRRPLLPVYIDTCQVCPLLPPSPPPPIFAARSPPSPSRERRERKGVLGEGEGGRTREPGNRRHQKSLSVQKYIYIRFIFAIFGKPHLGAAPHIWRISTPPPPPPSPNSYGWHRRERGKIPLLLLLLLLFLPTRERRHQAKSEEEPSLFPPSSPPAKIHKHPVSKYRGECT